MNDRKRKFKEEKENREKEEKEKRKSYNNNKLIAIFGALVIFIFFLDPYLSPQTKKQAFSLSETEIHKFAIKTAKLNNPFYVSKEYFTEKFPKARK